MKFHDLKSGHAVRTDRFFRFRGKRVLVMGLGLHGGGVGAVKFLAKNGAKITVTDLRRSCDLESSLRELRSISSIKYVLGRHRKKDFVSPDLIVKNPGVFPDSFYLKIARKHGVKVTSDIGIFLRYCPAKIIGVTGTRGKSTTSYLIWKLLKTKYPRTFLAGNIRKSVLTLMGKLRKEDIVVLELSSFQLADLAQERISPNVAVITNILRDHLNWHGTMQKYIAAKSIIFKYQQKTEYLFINPLDALLRKIALRVPAKTIYPKLQKKFKKIIDQNLGKHYRSSANLAIAVAIFFNVKSENIMQILANFTGLEGREEYIGNFHGIKVINDTTATIPEATINAIKRFRPLADKLILIAGGQDKKLVFKTLVPYLKKMVDNLILLPGTATQKMTRALKKKDYILVLSMDEAVQKATKLASPGDYILLSPGAASFGLFQNEFDRGNKFVASVKSVLEPV